MICIAIVAINWPFFSKYTDNIPAIDGVRNPYVHFINVVVEVLFVMLGVVFLGWVITKLIQKLVIIQ